VVRAKFLIPRLFLRPVGAACPGLFLTPYCLSFSFLRMFSRYTPFLPLGPSFCSSFSPVHLMPQAFHLALFFWISSRRVHFQSSWQGFFLCYSLRLPLTPRDRARFLGQTCRECVARIWLFFLFIPLPACNPSSRCGCWIDLKLEKNK